MRLARSAAGASGELRATSGSVLFAADAGQISPPRHYPDSTRAGAAGAMATRAGIRAAVAVAARGVLPADLVAAALVNLGRDAGAVAAGDPGAVGLFLA